jgi:hypothetical protein
VAAQYATGNLPQRFVLTPGPDGTANLSLEVFNAAVGPNGLGVKAVWPEEGIEHAVVVVPGSVANSTVATLAPIPTATPAPTATGTPVPGPFPLRVCVLPNPVTAGQTATIYVQTVSGAVCSATLRYSGGAFEPNLTTAVGQVAGPDGFAVFPFTVSGGTSPATATAYCTYQGVTENASQSVQVITPPSAFAQAAAIPVPAICKTGQPGGQAAIGLSNAAPPRFSFEGVIGCFFYNGAPVIGVPTTISLNFANGTSVSCETSTGLNGFAGCSLYVGSAPPGFKVIAVVNFFYQGVNYQASTSFYPS